MSVEKDVGTLLKHQRKTIAVAEACTAGMVGFLLTSIPGSSSYFYGGVLCYARAVKVNVLGVHSETLATYGSVHRVTALEMALRVRELCESEIGIATTGVAGPGGGTSERLSAFSMWQSLPGKDMKNAGSRFSITIVAMQIGKQRRVCRWSCLRTICRVAHRSA